MEHWPSCRGSTLFARPRRPRSGSRTTPRPCAGTRASPGRQRQQARPHAGHGPGTTPAGGLPGRPRSPPLIRRPLSGNPIDRGMPATFAIRDTIRYASRRRSRESGNPPPGRGRSDRRRTPGTGPLRLHAVHNHLRRAGPTARSSPASRGETQVAPGCLQGHRPRQLPSVTGGITPGRRTSNPGLEPRAPPGAARHIAASPLRPRRPRMTGSAVHTFVAADTSTQTTPLLPSWSAITVSEGALLSSTTVPPAATAAAIRCAATSGAT